MLTKNDASSFVYTNTNRNGGDPMSDDAHRQFSEKLVQHSAPTLLGIKCASLFSLSSQEFDLPHHAAIFNRRAGVKGLRCRILCQCKNRILLLVFRESLLARRLQEPWAAALLHHLGYEPEKGIQICLEKLASRIAESSEFPHEIGIFLGYPKEDVLGFIANKGANCKLCGCWKVYGNIGIARQMFARYRKCHRYLHGRLAEGQDLYTALKIPA